VSPCPKESTLIEYYADSHEYWKGQPLDYSIENRIELLRKNVPNKRNLSFVEVGGNDSERFRAALPPLITLYTNIEVNRSCDGTMSTLDGLPPESADVFSLYFVLEHVARPAELLGLCVHALKSDGLLIVEVPNLYIYPLNPAGLVWWEHTNHFSPLSLTSLAVTKGLHLRELSYHLCSRPFGFAAVFSKTNQGSNRRLSCESAMAMGQHEYHLAKACMMDGLKLIEGYREHLEEVRIRIRDVCEAGEKVVIWAANKVCIDLLDNFHLPDTAIVIDSNPEKRNYLQPVPVYEPHLVKEFILSAKLIVINTRLFTDNIIEYIKHNIGRELSRDEIILVKSIG